MRLTPLGAGNCQFVYRIDRDSWTASAPSTGPWSHCSVLKITRKPDCSMLLRRMLYHDEFALFMQESTHSKGEYCTPRRVCCAIERNVARRLRVHLSKLLDTRKNGYLKPSARTKSHCNSEVLFKKHIYHIKEVAMQTSLSVEPGSIYLIDGIHSGYDPRLHELAILEEDMFNLSVCVSLGRQMVRNAMWQYRNISLELKPKCGLLNFSGLPTLFQMCQPYKARIRYQNIIETEERWSPMERLENGKNHIEMSQYSPHNFFSMRLEDVKKELLHLSKTPQNNIRIFVDNIEVSPELLYYDRYALDTVASCIVENRKIVERILKLQALASGQQFVSYMVYHLTKLVVLFGDKCLPQRGDVLYGHNSASIANNMSKTSRYLLSLVLCNKANRAYEIQRLFNLVGRQLICSLCTLLILILERSGQMFYASRINLAMDRTRFRSRGGNGCHACATYLRRKLAVYSQGQLVNGSGAHDGAVNLVMFDKLDRILHTVERSRYSWRQKGHKAETGKFHSTAQHTCGSKRATPRKFSLYSMLSRKGNSGSSKCGDFLDSCYRWIELYLGGRTAMDLSIVLNVLFHVNGDKSKKQPNFFRFSLIDLDMKPAERIPRWKEDMLLLIRENRFNYV